MLHLTCANQMEALVEPLAQRIEAARQADPLGAITLIVPDQAVAQFLRFRLAERLGVAAHLQFTFLTRFLRERVEAVAPELEVLDPDRLQLLLYNRLRTPGFVAQPDMQEVGRYLDRAGSVGEREMRALQLAGQLGRLFEEYGYSRRDLLRAWRTGLALQGTPVARAERWQRVLWRDLFHAPPPPGTQAMFDFGGPATEPTSTRLLLTDAVLRAMQTRRDLLGGAVHVFGLSYVAPAFAELFARLAQRQDLFVYVINPCMEFWEDVEQADESLRRAVRQGWIHRGEKLLPAEGADISLDPAADQSLLSADPFELDRPGDAPALRLWGRPGREYVRLLNQLTDCRFQAVFRDPGQGSLLARIQHDVLARTPERPLATEGEPDGSIRFLACPGVRREVEVVADHIWSLVRARAAAGRPVRFHQIAVMVADPRREDYLTHVDAVFRERHSLPFNLIDRPLAGQSRVVEAIDRLLELPTGTFEYAELMRLLTHPAVGGADPESDPTRWRRWGAALNIRFGADRTDLEDTYIDRDVFNWDQALRRLVLGAFVTGEKAGDPRPVSLSTGLWMPFETPADALGEVGRLVALARCLIADARELRRTSLSVKHWAALFARLFTRYLTAQRVDDELALSRALASLEALGAADLEGVEVGFEVARALVRERLAGLEGGRGQHQADGVVVSSLMPMRAVPFEAIYVLGLGEGRFPAPVRSHPLDLRQARRQPGDVTPAERDRYLFLETLLAARQTLVLSYVARDPTSGDVLEPSSVVKELQYLLRGYVPPERLDDLVETHPISSYDLSYFPDLTGESSELSVQSASIEARRGAQARALRHDLERHLDAPSPASVLDDVGEETRSRLAPVLRLPSPPSHLPGPPERRVLPLYALQRFLESPLQGAAQYVLGLRADEASQADPDEPLVVDRQARTTLLREAFFEGNGDAPAVERAWNVGFERLMLKGEAPVGLFADVRRQEDLAVLAAWCSHLERLELPALAQWRVHRLGRARSGEGKIDQLLDPIEVEVALSHERTVVVELHGRLQPLAPDAGACLRCQPGVSTSDRSFLSGFFTVAALAAAGVALPPVVRALVLPGGPASPGALEHRYAVPPADVCRDWLKLLVTDLMTNVHDYRMPLEAVLEWWKEREFRPNNRLFIKREVGERETGPVRDPERFLPPEPAELKVMASRRLSIWFEAQRWARGG